MANALALTAPSALIAVAGIPLAGNSNGNNSAAYTFANGASGAADTLANAQLVVGVPTISRLYAFLTKAYTNQAELRASAAALGVTIQPVGGVAPGCTLTTFAWDVTAVTLVPKATVTTTAATGAFRIAMPASISQ